MAQQLRALIALPEVMSSNPSNHMVAPIIRNEKQTNKQTKPMGQSDLGGQSSREKRKGGGKKERALLSKGYSGVVICKRGREWGGVGQKRPGCFVFICLFNSLICLCIYTFIYLETRSYYVILADLELAV